MTPTYAPRSADAVAPDRAADLVAVTGATGKTGRRLLAHLVAQGHAARPLARRTPTPFRWEDETTWTSALAGVTSVYLVVPHLLPDAVRTIERLASRAAELGVRRQVLLSARNVGEPGTESYAAVEASSSQAGPETTILRPTWFAQNFSEDWLEPSVRQGLLRLPEGDLRDPFIDAGDIAEVAAAALTSDAFLGRTIELSGPRVLSFREAVGIIGSARGIPVTYQEVEIEEYRAELLTHGYAEDEVSSLFAILDLLREGRSDHLATGVQDVLGRPPRDLAAYAADAAATGAWRPATAA